MLMLLITARKRSLGQGNIFIDVCQEFCSQGRSVPGGVCSRGVSAPGGCLLPGVGDVYSQGWGVSDPGGWGVGGVCSGGVVPGGHPQRILLRAVRILLECILV